MNQYDPEHNSNLHCGKLVGVWLSLCFKTANATIYEDLCVFKYNTITQMWVAGCFGCGGLVVVPSTQAVPTHSRQACCGGLVWGA